MISKGPFPPQLLLSAFPWLLWVSVLMELDFARFRSLKILIVKFLMNSPAPRGYLFSFALSRQTSACCPWAKQYQSTLQKKEGWVWAKNIEMRVEEKFCKSALPGRVWKWCHQSSLGVQTSVFMCKRTWSYCFSADYFYFHFRFSDFIYFRLWKRKQSNTSSREMEYYAKSTHLL